MANPEEFITHHYPSNKYWQLTTSPISLDNFFENPLFQPEYFKTKIKLNDGHHGLIKAIRNQKITLVFDKVPDGIKLSYSSKNYYHTKPLRLKWQGQFYVATIKVDKKMASILSVYADNKPIIDFKLDISE